MGLEDEKTKLRRNRERIQNLENQRNQNSMEIQNLLNLNLISPNQNNELNQPVLSISTPNQNDIDQHTLSITTPNQNNDINQPALIQQPQIEQDVRPPYVPPRIQMITPIDEEDENINISKISTENLRLHIKRLTKRIDAFDKLNVLTPQDIRNIALSLNIPFTYNGPNNRQNTKISDLINVMKNHKNEEDTYDDIKQKLNNFKGAMETELNSRRPPGAPSNPRGKPKKT